jgi:predicted nucleic acid-binding protein
MKECLELGGKKMAATDSLIAATVLQRNLSLVTRNEKNFKYPVVQIINPWKA